MEKMDAATLGFADYAVIGLTMCASVGIGLYYRFSGGRQKTTQEYFSADKSMGVTTISVALMVSFMSAITLLGVSAENYSFGTQFIVINLGYLIGTPLVCYGYLPVFFNLQVISAYEYLDRRFGYGARLAASFAYWVQLLLYSAIVLYAPALALEATTRLPRHWSIILLGLVCAFYSTIGGIKAVLITDVVQGFLMFVSMFLVIGTALYKVGGFSEIWRIADQGGRIEFDSTSIDPSVRHTWWGLLVGGFFTFLSLYGVNQVQVQRMMTLRSVKSARRALWMSWPILTGLSILICFSGLAIYSYYYKCDPIASGRISTSDMLMPLYVMDTLSDFPGLPGLFVAGIFSAGLSTISAGLNSLAAVTLEDYVKPLYVKCSRRQLSESKSIVFGKILAFLYGIACILLAFTAQYFGGLLQLSQAFQSFIVYVISLYSRIMATLTIFGAVGGPLLGIFTLGMLTETANQSGAVCGMLTSLAFIFWIAFGQPRPAPVKLPVSILGCDVEHVIRNSTKLLNQMPNDAAYFYLYRISYVWYGALGFIVTMLIGYLISLITSKIAFFSQSEVSDPDLFFPCVAERIRFKRLHKSRVNENVTSYNLSNLNGNFES